MPRKHVNHDDESRVASVSLFRTGKLLRALAGKPPVAPGATIGTWYPSPPKPHVFANEPDQTTVRTDFRMKE